MWCWIEFPNSASITPDEALLRPPANLPVAAPILPSLKLSITAILLVLAKYNHFSTSQSLGVLAKS